MTGPAGKMNFGPLLAALTLVVALTAAGTVRANDEAGKKAEGREQGLEAALEVNDDLVNEYKKIAQTVEIYIDGGRQGSSEIMKQAFHPGANIYGFADGELVGGPVQTLYDLVDSRPPAGLIPYSITRLEAMEDVAMVRVDIDDWAGARYCDMLSLVKTEGQWRITSKVSHKF